MLFIDWLKVTTNKINNTTDKYISDINLITLKVLNKKISDIDSSFIINEVKLKELDKYLKEYLTTDKPIAYILGFELFLDQIIKVSEDTLIPRQETEELVLILVNKIKETFKSGSTIKIADVCTGTGVIGISLFFLLKNDYDVHIYLTDISNEALIIARKNLELHNVSKYEVFQGNLLEPLIQNNIKVDVLTSNPPYIPLQENIQASVDKYEPPLALYTKDNKGLEYYNSIISNSKFVLKETYLMCFEISNYHSDFFDKSFTIYSYINNIPRIALKHN
ncbi:MAG: HemK family protein methyltransferase [Mycoplasmatales bacterium]